MAMTPDGAIVTAGGTFSAFVMARFTPDGDLDTGFGARERCPDRRRPPSQQESLGVAIQADGKIVLAGYTASGVGVARFLPDGQPDESFGTGGAVTAIATGQALDVALQPRPDVLAGIATVDRGDDFGDLFVTRLLEDGSPDPSFDLSSQVFTDVLGQANQAQNVRIQPDGMIVVSGSSPNPGSDGVGIDDHTDLARYQPGGLLDPGFGDGGTVRLDAFVGAGLAIQPDGRLVLVGTADTTPPTSPPGTFTDIAVMRLNPDGTPDETFGERGSVHFSASASTSRSARGATPATMSRCRPTGGSSSWRAPVPSVLISRSPVCCPTASRHRVDRHRRLRVDFSRSTDIAENVAVTSDGRSWSRVRRAAARTATAWSGSRRRPIVLTRCRSARTALSLPPPPREGCR